MTLRRNLEFAAERRPRLERHRRVNEMLERFRLAEFAGRHPHEVSGGQKQRCSIARAVIRASEAVIARDEPARGLDAPLRGEFHDVLRELRAEFRVPILMVTHDLDGMCGSRGPDAGVRERTYRAKRNAAAVLAQPASGSGNAIRHTKFFAAEILELNPRRQLQPAAVAGPRNGRRLFSGTIIGAAASCSCRRRELGLHAEPGENRVRTVVNSVEEPSGTRREYSAGITVDVRARCRAKEG